MASDALFKRPMFFRKAVVVFPRQVVRPFRRIRDLCEDVALLFNVRQLLP
jgi:hypothetical protein